jgi:hypothetical protein
VSLKPTPAKQPDAPSFRVLGAKVETENLDERTHSLLKWDEEGYSRD